MPGDVERRACSSEAAVTHSVFLIGDAGAPKLAADTDAATLVDPVLRSLHEDVGRQVASLGIEDVAVVFLGDNVYPRGLVAPGEKRRAQGERILREQIAAARPAEAIFVAGNHDWEIEGARGWDHVRFQDEFLRAQGDGVRMLPPGGCAGPERVDFGPYLRFVFLDPIGWQHALAFPEEHRPACPAQGARDVILALGDEFDRPEGKHVVLALHHPLVTAGPHGGHFTWKQHLFPLTDFVSWLWLPLPGIGSLYPVSRQLGVTTTDMASGPYRGVIRGIYRASRPRVPILVAAGHEHSLQVHHDLVGLYYAVSGAGSAKKVDRVERLDTAILAEAVPGYMRLDVRSDGSLELDVRAVENEGPARSIFRQCLADGPTRASSH